MITQCAATSILLPLIAKSNFELGLFENYHFGLDKGLPDNLPENIQQLIKNVLKQEYKIVNTDGLVRYRWRGYYGLQKEDTKKAMIMPTTGLTTM